jgi:hypothetical protein
MPYRKRAFGNGLVAIVDGLRKPPFVFFLGVGGGWIDVAGNRILRPVLRRQFRLRSVDSWAIELQI